MSRNGSVVADFEREFAEYVGARFALALVNGTATLHTALVALGVGPRDRVAVPPLTMSATTIAVLQAGAVPVFWDVDPKTWLMSDPGTPADYIMPVSLYGLHQPKGHELTVDDAAQTLRPHSGAAFTSYSFQSSKILSTGEGGMLVTNSEELATRARSFSSLGYKLDPKSPRIDSALIKRPDYARHYGATPWNYRMNDVTAAEGLRQIKTVGIKKAKRQASAMYYREAIQGCDWITPQFVPEGWSHCYWAYAVALESKELWTPFTDSIVRHGGEMPYGAWRLTYQEPAFRHLHTKRAGTRFPTPGGWPGDCIERVKDEPLCPVAENLQPRLVQFQSNNMDSAKRNADAVSKAIKEIGGGINH